MPENLHIYKASAGSGKTFRLTEEYILLLFNNQNEYRHVLAVTFTNKATAEMKGRVLSELGKISSGSDSPHIAAIRKKYRLPDSEIKQRATGILMHILHDYSRFSVETIDTFFQRIFRSFTYELNLPGNLTIEIEHQELLEEAVEELMRNNESGSYLHKWLFMFASKRIAEGKNWNFRTELLELAEQIFNEKFRLIAQNNLEEITSPESLKKYAGICKSTLDSYVKNITRFGEKALKMMEDHGLVIDDFFQKKKGIPGFFRRLADGEIFEPNKYVTDAWNGDEKSWVSAKSRNREKVLSVKQNGMEQLLDETLDFINREEKFYYTAEAAIKNIYSLGLILEISKRLRRLAEEKNVFFLADTGPLISSLIQHNTSPFIYEKMGSTYHHYMIDEFQDTSEIQWNNFKPLLNESLATGYKNLLVGDVKQSIYRWRNSNWNILATGIREQFSEAIRKEITLNTNWRSLPNIVRFNNELYAFSSCFVQGFFNDTFQSSIENLFANTLRNAYADVLQNLPDKKEFSRSGTILMKILEEDTWQDQALEEMVVYIKNLLEKGKSYGDITLLVRNQKEGQMVANKLLSHQEEFSDISGQPFQVISNSALALKNSRSIKLLLSFLKYILDPGDLINCTQLIFLLNPALKKAGLEDIRSEEYLSSLLPKKLINNIAYYRSLPLIQVIEEVCTLSDVFQNPSQQSFIYAFIDQVYAFADNNSVSLSTFVDWWDEKGDKKALSSHMQGNALQIMTIHKSKGLEFNTVILPFCDWNMDRQSGTRDFIWCEPHENPFNQMTILPLDYSKKLAKSIFVNEYEFERIQNYVDNLNILYVASTRAIENLFILSPKTNPPRESIRCSHFIDAFFSQAKERLGDEVTVNDNMITLGAFTDKSFKNISNNNPENVITDAGRGTFDTGRILQEFQHRHVFIETLNAQDKSILDYGKLMHHIFEHISTMNDIDKAVDGAVKEGLIDIHSASHLSKEIEGLIIRSGVTNWFNGESRVLSESSILLPGGILRRPDRIIVNDHESIVVDYKFGRHQDEKHLQQVREYKNILGGMNYNNLTGYVWYVILKQVVQV